MSSAIPDSVQIEISIEKLEALFNAGHLCANDFRCLNHDAKQIIRDLCLSTCAKTMHCHQIHKNSLLIML